MFLINPYIYGGGVFTNAYSLIFDGVDEYVDCGNNPSGLSSSQNFSFSFWYKHGGTGHLFGINALSSNRIGGTMSGSEIRFFINSNRGSKASAILDTNWHHIAMVFDGTQGTDAGKCKIYIDGSNQTLSFSGTIDSSSGSLVGQPFYIGRFTTDYTNGSIDEFRIYDYSLSSGDVSSIYNTGTPKDDDLATPAVHYWRNGDDDTYPTITDIGTAGGNDGTMTNMESGDIQTDVP